MAKETKRKIEIKKLETKKQRAVACSKRRRTLFSKAADLCLSSGANIAVFVTSPANKSNVTDSFSGHSSASEIAQCFLDGKLPPNINPPSKLGFWWTDPDLYHSCNDMSELSIIEDRMKRAKTELIACLEKQENPRLSFDHRKPSSSLDGGSSSKIVSGSYQNPSSSLQNVSFDQNPRNSLHGSSHVAAFGLKPWSSVEGVCSGESSSDEQTRYLVNSDLGCFNCSRETEKENKQIKSLPQEKEPIINPGGGYDDQSFWDELYEENALDNTSEEDDLMIDIGEYLSD